MTRKPIALVPLAAAIAAMAPAADAVATVDQNTSASRDATTNHMSGAGRTPNLFYNHGDQLMSMVAYQQADGTMQVQPDSHVSHASHSSHSSHASHASSI